MLKILSEIPKGIPLNLNDLVQTLEYCNIVYMCIKQAGCSEYQIPSNLETLINQVIGSIYKLNENLYEDDWTKYCYLTIKKMYVQPNTSGNREGFHIDGFKSDQENFIWSDCAETPTEVAIGNFLLSNDHEKSLGEMIVQSSKCFKYQLSPNTLYEVDHKCVHRPTVNNTNKTILRTFIKITYSKELFIGIGNAWNYMLPHIKPTKNRSVERNHGTLY